MSNFALCCCFDFSPLWNINANCHRVEMWNLMVNVPDCFQHRQLSSLIDKHPVWEMVRLCETSTHYTLFIFAMLQSSFSYLLFVHNVPFGFRRFLHFLLSCINNAHVRNNLTLLNHTLRSAFQLQDTSLRTSFPLLEVKCSEFIDSPFTENHNRNVCAKINNNY